MQCLLLSVKYLGREQQRNTMESISRIFKVIVQFQEKDEVFYTRVKSINGVPGSLIGIISARYPSLATLIKRCYVNGKLIPNSL